MKTTESVPKQLVIIIFFLLTLVNIAIAQSTFVLNGKDIMLEDGNYYELSEGDTIQLDTLRIVVYFKFGLVEEGITRLVEYYQFSNSFKLNDFEYAFNLPDSAGFVESIDEVLSVSEVDSVFFGYIYVVPTFDYPNSQGGTPGIPSSYYFRHYPNDELYIEPWELMNTQVCDNGQVNPLEWAWAITVGIPGIKVAIIDNGLVWDDEDFYPDNGLGYDFIDNDNDVTPPVPSPNNYVELGTAQASIIAGRTSNEHGLYGVAGGYYENENTPPITIIPYRALINTSLYSIPIEQSIMNAIENQVDIIQIGWYINQYNFRIHKAINCAARNGILFFAPTGIQWEGYTESIYFPASLPQVVAVGGTDVNDNRATWSYNNIIWGTIYGEGLDFSLPCKFVQLRDIYEAFNGGPAILIHPAISSALASGIAALVYSVQPCISAESVKEILNLSCDKTGTYNYVDGWSEELGYGRLNAYKAVNIFKPGETITGSATWDTPKFITGDIVVESGADLTIQSKVRLAPGVKIIVLEGGVLNLDGAYLTSLCNESWSGIEVRGEPDLAQEPCYQGKLVAFGSKIENAFAGISVCDSLEAISISGFVGLGGGGIIEASDVDIKDCSIGMTFAPYPENNTSYLKRCNIVYTNESDQVIAGGLFLNSINDLSLKGTHFKNLREEGDVAYGIRAFNSGFIVDEYCDDIEAPCQEGYGISSLIEKFKYGIYIENIGTDKFVSIKNTGFNLNRFGLYGSGLLLPTVLLNNFRVLDDSEESYGIYLNECNLYIVEENIFESSQTTTHNEIGIFINNSGGDENEIYNNKFYYFSHAAVAYNVNRDYEAQTGLCFRCNDFIGCDVDIAVPEPVDPPISYNHGIRQYQGIYGSEDWDAASNTFSLNGTNNFNNEIDELWYIMQTSTNPSGTKIEPDPHSEKVQLDYNFNTTFNKDISCPPHSEFLSELEYYLARNESESKLDSLSIILESFIDNGDTEGLNTFVETAFPSQTYDIYTDLMAIAPYVSNEVMKTSIDKTDVLLDAMLRDVLVANPSSAKSSEVMLSLEQRPVPLPEEMVEEVENGVNIISSREHLQLQILGEKELWAKAHKGLLRLFASDTSASQRRDSILSLLSSTNSLSAKIQLALLECDNEDVNAANVVMNSIPINFELTEAQLNEYETYQNYLDALIQLRSVDINYLNPDSLAQSQLLSLYELPNSTPGAFARNILHAAGIINYSEPIYVGCDNKSGRSIHVSNSKKSNENPSLEVFPNPAKEYCIVKYMLPVNSSSGKNRIIDMTGRNLLSKPINTRSNSVVIPLIEMPQGTYRILLETETDLVGSVQLFKI